MMSVPTAVSTRAASSQSDQGDYSQRLSVRTSTQTTSASNRSGTASQCRASDHDAEEEGFRRGHGHALLNPKA